MRCHANDSDELGDAPAQTCHTFDLGPCFEVHPDVLVQVVVRLCEQLERDASGDGQREMGRGEWFQRRCHGGVAVQPDLPVHHREAQEREDGDGEARQIHRPLLSFPSLGQFGDGEPQRLTGHEKGIVEGKFGHLCDSQGLCRRV